MVDPTQPATSIRLRMSHGCLQSVTAAANVRILHIKGVSLHPLLAQGRPESTDADILVDPAEIDRTCRALISHGWQQLTSFAHGSVFHHAAAFHHTTWGTVDVHRSFPGLDQEPQETFDRLWESADSVVLGGSITCRVPDLISQRLLLLTHAARSSSPTREHDIAANWTRLTEDERRQIDSAAAEFGGVVPLALVTNRPEQVAGKPEEHLWRAIHAGASPLQIRRAQLRDAHSVRERLRILTEMLRVNRDHLGLRLGHRPSDREVRQEWWARLRRHGRRVDG